MKRLQNRIYCAVICVSVFAVLAAWAKTPGVDRPQKAGVVVDEETGVSAGEPFVLSKDDCSQSKDYLSLSYLRALMLDPSEFAVIADRKRSKIKMSVAVPDHIKHCVNLKFEIRPVPKHKGKFYMMVKNTYFEMNPKKVEEYFDGDEYEKFTQDQRLTRCLEKSGIYDSAKHRLNPQVSDYQTSNDTFLTNYTALGKDRDAHMYFLSPTASDRFGDTVTSIKSKDKCFRFDNFVKKGSYELIDRKIEELKSDFENCDGSPECSKENYEKIMGIIDDAGNFATLSKATKKLLEDKLDHYGKKIAKYDEGKANEYYDELESRAKQIKDSEDEDVIDDLGDEYVEILYKLQTEMIDPAIEELKEKYELRAKTKNKEKKNALDKRIKALNKIIGKLDTKKSLKVNPVLRKFEKYGMSDKAHELALARLTSHEFSNVKHKGDKKQKPKMAQKKIDRQVKQYKKNLKLAEQVASAKSGDVKYAKGFARELKVLRKAKINQWKRFNEKEKKLAKNCQPKYYVMGGASNPVRCRMYHEGKAKRFRRAKAMLGKYDLRIEKQELKVDRFLTYEAEGRIKKRKDGGLWDLDIDDPVLEFRLLQDDTLDYWSDDLLAGDDDDYLFYRHNEYSNPRFGVGVPGGVSRGRGF